MKKFLTLFASVFMVLLVYSLYRLWLDNNDLQFYILAMAMVYIEGLLFRFFLETLSIERM